MVAVPIRPIIAVVEVEKDLRSMFFALSYRSAARRAFNRKTMSKEYVYSNLRQMYIFLGF